MEPGMFSNIPDGFFTALWVLALVGIGSIAVVTGTLLYFAVRAVFGGW